MYLGSFGSQDRSSGPAMLCTVIPGRGTIVYSPTGSEIDGVRGVLPDKKVLRKKVHSQESLDLFGFLNMLVSKMLAFAEVFGGPGGFRQAREASRNNILLYSSPESDLMVPSSDQQTKYK